MKAPLRTFRQFAAMMLPHEGRYLAQEGHFEHPDNQLILQRLVHNTLNPDAAQPFDPAIDKRKYSRVKTWVQEKLAMIDVDRQYAWITHLEQQIMLDAIQPEEERKLLKMLRGYEQPAYYFMKLYDLAEHYRQYLLVRMRHRAYEEVQDFLERQTSAYHRSKTIYARLHQATLDITRQYSQHNTESLQWEEWLQTVFGDTSVDGLNRYVAAVRLTFLYLNYREFRKLKTLFEGLDILFAEGLLYSRRILLNYYSNCLLLYSKTDQLELAARYGYLSIRQQNADFLHYLNNLCAVLLRLDQVGEALTLMDAHREQVRVSPSSHSKVTFAALYTRCQYANGHWLEALRYAERFLRGYQTEVLSQRWHAFFLAYFQVLLQLESYDKMLRCGTRHKLVGKEVQYCQGGGHLPLLTCYLAVAQYKEGRINAEQMTRALLDPMPQTPPDAARRMQFITFLSELKPHIPLIFKTLAPEIDRWRDQRRPGEKK